MNLILYRSFAQTNLPDLILFLEKQGQVVFVDAKRHLVVWDFVKEEIQRLEDPITRLRGLQKSFDEDYIAVLSDQRNILFKYDGNRFLSLGENYYSATGGLVFTRDSSSLIFHTSQVFFQRRLSDGEYWNLAETDYERCNGADLHPGGHIAAFSTCAQGGSSLSFLNLSSDAVNQCGQETEELNYFSYDELTRPTFSPDGKWLSVGHCDVELFETKFEDSNRQLRRKYIFDLEGSCVSNRSKIFPLPYQRLWTKQVFDMQRQLLIAGSPDGKIFAWRLSDGSIYSQVQAHQGKVFDIAFSASHDLLFSCGADGVLKSWTME